MKIVINITEELYKKISLNNPPYGEDFPLYYAVRNCIKLPKGHGDLIDRRELKEHLYACETNGRPLYVMELHERLDVIDEVDAVIEADKENEQE